MEYWDIYDKNRQKTGNLVRRGESMTEGDYHLVVFAFLRNVDGKFLISKRAPGKICAGQWEITGGSAIVGDDSLSAILREVKEEVGLTLDEKKGKLIKSFRVDCANSFFADIWLFEHEIRLDEVVCQEEEVSQVRLVEKYEIKSLIEKGEFIKNSNITECLEMI